MGGTDEKELEARVRAYSKERLMHMEATCEYPGDEAGLPTTVVAVEERLAKGASMWSKFQHASAKGIRPEVVNVILPVVKDSRRWRRTGWEAESRYKSDWSS